MIIEAVSDEQILATREVIRQLRPHLPVDEYLPTVKRMIETDSYPLTAYRMVERCPLKLILLLAV